MKKDVRDRNDRVAWRRISTRRPFGRALLALLLVGCSESAAEDSAPDAEVGTAPLDATTSPADTAPPDTAPSAEDAAGANDASAPPVADGRAPDAAPDAEPDAEDAARCATRITYGNAWIHAGTHPLPFDDADGRVTWDGVCVDDGANSYALLSNGWKPYFTGHSACVMALDYTACAGAPTACATRVSYGAAWLPPANHPQTYDDLQDRILWDRACTNTGNQSFATLSNGWAPHFTGNGACALSFTHTQCGGLYANPVLPTDCADPGVLRDGARYVMTCTSGNAANAFPIRVSTDLITWTSAGSVFPSGSKPAWAGSDFWAPEIHRVGNSYVAYFTARHTDGKLSIGAAVATSALGPFTDIGQPLLHDAAMGLIDATEFEAPDGTRYLVWKEDGNAVGKPTPIRAQPLAADGRSLTGSAVTLITNDQGWEGGVVEGPWMVFHGGSYYLFYSGNSYANATYAVGVARASSPLGPFTKAPGPIVTTSGPWVGPGHCSVVDTPGGDTYMVYHAWRAGHVNTPGDGRVPLVDRVLWDGAWPRVPVAPSSTSMPTP